LWNLNRHRDLHEEDPGVFFCCNFNRISIPNPLPPAMASSLRTLKTPEMHTLGIVVISKAESVVYF
jgi:hypothetical protein